MSNRSRNTMRHSVNRIQRRGRHRLIQQQQPQQRNNNDVIPTIDAAATMPRPVTKNKKTVIFDLHGGMYTYMHLMLALEDQFNKDAILSTRIMEGTNYCQSNCILAEVLFATPEARTLAVTRGVTIDGIRFVAVPVVDDVSYKYVYKFRTPQQGNYGLNWPDNLSEFNTRGTVFVINDLPLDSANVMIRKVVSSMTADDQETDAASKCDVKQAHPVVTVFVGKYVSSPLLKNTVYVVVHGHVDSFSMFKQVDAKGHGTVHLSAYESHHRGFSYSQVKFDRVFCFNCEKSDCHFTEDCNDIQVVRFIRERVIPETGL